MIAIGLVVDGSVHAIDGESKCTTFHVVVKNPDLPEENSSIVGSLIELNGSPYVIEWTGTGYYTASGRILHAVESSGQITELVEVRPLSGIVHQARWQDVDLDGRLSVSDTVIVNGVSEQIVDTRLNLRVVPKR